MKLANFILLMLFFCLSCGQDRVVESYSDMSENSAGCLELTDDNHAHGWRQSDCFYCHMINNIHQDKEECGVMVVGVYEENDCLDSCHGNNGL